MKKTLLALVFLGVLLAQGASADTWDRLVGQNMTAAALPVPYVAWMLGNAGASGNPAWMAFDNFTTGAGSTGDAQWNGVAPPVYIAIDLGAANATKVNGYNLTASCYNSTRYDIKSWTIMGSNDNSTWTHLDKQTNIVWTGCQRTLYNTNATTTYRYYKLQVDAFTQASNIGLLAEWMLLRNTTTPGPAPSGSVNNITFRLNNTVNGTAWPSNVQIYNLTGASLVFTFYNITWPTGLFTGPAGFCVSYTGNGTGYNCTGNTTATHNWFNYTITVSVTGNDTINASTFNNYLNVTATRLFLNTSIASFNTTNNLYANSTTTGSALIPSLTTASNVLVAVNGNYSRNVTCTNSNPFTTQDCVATGFHDLYYAFNATDLYNVRGISNFSLRVSNSSLGGQVYWQNTTNGTLNFSLLQGYNYFVEFTTPNMINQTYEELNVSLAGNASNQKYTFEVFPTPGIDLVIRDADTGLLITQNLTIVLTNNLTGETVYTTSGGYFLANLTAGQTNVRIGNANYSDGVYTVTPSGGSIVYLTVYLQQNASDVVMQLIDRTSGEILVGAAISQARLVNGSWETISSRVTDITGRTVFGYRDDVAYRFTAVADGYNTKTFDLDPVLFSTYTIRMDRISGLDSREDFQSVYVGYTPQLFYDGQLNALNITFDSPTGTFQNYTYTVVYPGGQKNGSGANAVGELFNMSINITGASITSKVNITLTYTTTNLDVHTFRYQNGIVVSPGNHTFISNQDNTYGLGLIERLIIGTIVIVIAAGFVTLGAGAIPGLVLGLLIMGFFIYMGFWPWWAAGISFLVGFALIAGRTD